MGQILQLALVTAVGVGLQCSARAATFDFSLLEKGVSIGQGSFSFPDADLTQPYVDVSEFSAFDFTASGYTFALPDLVSGDYLPSTNMFYFSPLGADGFGYILNNPLAYYYSGHGFLISGFEPDLCYYNPTTCVPGAPLVFAGGSVTIVDGGVQTVVAGYDTIVITPATSVPEPSTMLLLGTSVIGVVHAVRRRRKNDTVPG